MRKNRKVIISIVIISVAGLLFFLVSKTIDKIRHKERIAQKIKTFPALSVIAIGNNDLADWKNAGNPTSPFTPQNLLHHTQRISNQHHDHGHHRQQPHAHAAVLPGGMHPDKHQIKAVACRQHLAKLRLPKP